MELVDASLIIFSISTGRESMDEQDEIDEAVLLNEPDKLQEAVTVLHDVTDRVEEADLDLILFIHGFSSG